MALLIMMVVGSGCRRTSPDVSAGTPGRHSGSGLMRVQWSPSGKWLLATQDAVKDDERLICVNARSKLTYAVASMDRYSGIESCAWDSKADQLSYAFTYARPSMFSRPRRVLRVADPTGKVLAGTELPIGFLSVGMQWTRDHRLVIADADTPNSDDPNEPTIIRVFSRDLTRERRFALPFLIYDLQTHPSLPNHAVAVAGGKYKHGLALIDLETGATKALPCASIASNERPLRWKLTSSGRVYFAKQTATGNHTGGLYVCDLGSAKARRIADGGAFGGPPIARFDALGTKAVVNSGTRLFVVDAATGHVSPVARTMRYYCPALSPDGRRLAALRSLNQLVVRDLATGSETVVYTAR